MITRRRDVVAWALVFLACTSGPAMAGTLDVLPEAAYAGERGLRVVIDDPRATYVEDTLPFLAEYRARFYVNLDGVTFTGDGMFDLFSGFDETDTRLFQIFVARDGEQTSLRYAVLSNGAPGETVSPVAVDLAAGWRRIEISWKSGAGDGHLRVWVDESEHEGLTNLTNVFALRHVRLGVASTLEPTSRWISGAIDIDEFVSRERDRIGAAPTTIGIGDVRTNVNGAPVLISLFDAFADEEDADSELVFEVTTTTNEALFSSVTVDDDEGNLVLAFAMDATGTAGMTVRATDRDELFVETTFSVIVSGPPTTSGIDDVSVNANADDTVISLFDAFDDAEDPDESLEYSVTNNSNPTLFAGIAIDGIAGTLTLAYAPDTGGAADLTVRATDPGGLFVETEFSVTVNAAPTTSGIADVTVPVGTAQSTLDLTASFEDAEDDAGDLTFALVENSNESLFDAAAVDNTSNRLVLVYATDVTGSSSLTVRATDSGGLFAESTFTVTVQPDAGGGFGCGGTRAPSGGAGDAAIMAFALAALFLVLRSRTGTNRID